MSELSAAHEVKNLRRWRSVEWWLTWVFGTHTTEKYLERERLGWGAVVAFLWNWGKGAGVLGVIIAAGGYASAYWERQEARQAEARAAARMHELVIGLSDALAGAITVEQYSASLTRALDEVARSPDLPDRRVATAQAPNRTLLLSPKLGNTSSGLLFGGDTWAADMPEDHRVVAVFVPNRLHTWINKGDSSALRAGDVLTGQELSELRYWVKGLECPSRSVVSFLNVATGKLRVIELRSHVPHHSPVICADEWGSGSSVAVGV